MKRIKTKYHYKKKGLKCVCPFFFSQCVCTLYAYFILFK